MFTFNLQKAIQAVGVLFREGHEKRIAYIRIIKLLYISEREMLKETGRPIIGDKIFAMDHGPVLSRVYDLVKGEAAGTDVWNRYYRREHYYLELCHSPDVGELSKHEVEKLRSVAKRYEDDNDWKVVRETHKFEEWIKNKPTDNSSNRIPLQDILAAIGREKDLPAIKQNQNDHDAYVKVFGG